MFHPTPLAAAALFLAATPLAIAQSPRATDNEGQAPSLALQGSTATAALRPHQDPDGAEPAPHGTELECTAAHVIHAIDVMPPGPGDQSLPTEGGIEGFQALEPIESALRHLEQEDGHWVRGRTFKARAAASGFTYVPFLGSHATRNYPVEFHLESATFADEEIPLPEAATVSVAGDRFILHRGPIQATYDVSLDQVEQSFVLEVPGGAGTPKGDLVLQLDVATDLKPRRDGAGFSFDGPEGSVRYGGAIAFDEGGTTVRVASRLTPTGIQLTVPAALFENAIGKVTVDPTITTFTVDDVARDQTSPDVTYVVGLTRWVFVHEDKFSNVDTDIYLVRTSGIGGQGFATYVEVGLEEWTVPRTATMAGTRKILIVAVRDNGAPQTAIVGRIFDADSSTLGSVLEIGDTGSAPVLWSNAAPDVGGAVAASDGDRPFIVVWERTFSSGDIAPRMRAVYGDGTMNPVASLQGSFGTLNQEVVINKGGTTPELWNVAYRRTDRTTGAITLQTLQLGRTGNIIAGPNAVTHLAPGGNPTSLDITNAISVAGLPATYIITYDDFAPGDSDVDAIVCAGATSRRRVDINAAEHALLGRNQNFPRVIAEWRSFAVVYYEPVPGGWQAYYSSLGVSEGYHLGVYGRRDRVGLPTTFIQGPPAISSTVPYTDISNTIQIAMIALSQWNDARSDFDIVAGSANTWGYLTRGFQFCDGVPNSTGDRAFIAVGGGNDPATTKFVVGWGFPPQNYAMLLVGTQPAQVPMAGGSTGTLCLGGTLGRFNNDLSFANPDGFVSFSVDPSQLPLGTGTMPALSGQTYHWQIWHRDQMPGATSNFSNGFSMTFR